MVLFLYTKLFLIFCRDVSTPFGMSVQCAVIWTMYCLYVRWTWFDLNSVPSFGVMFFFLFRLENFIFSINNRVCYLNVWFLYLLRGAFLSNKFHYFLLISSHVQILTLLTLRDNFSSPHIFYLNLGAIDYSYIVYLLDTFLFECKHFHTRSWNNFQYFVSCVRYDTLLIAGRISTVRHYSNGPCKFIFIKLPSISRFIWLLSYFFVVYLTF